MFQKLTGFFVSVTFCFCVAAGLSSCENDIPEYEPAQAMRTDVRAEAPVVVLKAGQGSKRPQPADKKETKKKKTVVRTTVKF